ncbi:hypothetical protein [Hufsiella ginkgonis]|uniref:Fibronectin type-III domain-containing protein n=1 Tax=Hufsiella ginkgonis TaxID=2695274 RepID=A0A7K1XZS4_9SPHI|nr:hypothetical protein [Hufsiella ginkgonis]MXV16036.1 hypothetical protein [Hufsiella ginkgonis]
MKRLILLVILSSSLYSCGSAGDDPQTEPVLPPAKATLLTPAMNEACTTGTVISDSESRITLKWTASDHTDGYEVNIKNLATGSTVKQPSIKAELEIALLRNTPYSWFVVSRSLKSTDIAQSDTWKFYNAGSGVQAYAPFPAEAVTPVIGQQVAAGTVKLEWRGGDVDNDITGYDVYFGTSRTPGVLSSNLTTSSVNASTAAKTTYYWKVVSKDSRGNSSDSGVFEFSTN